jgi:hypothetical protein
MLLNYKINEPMFLRKLMNSKVTTTTTLTWRFELVFAGISIETIRVLARVNCGGMGVKEKRPSARASDFPLPSPYRP